MSSRNALFLAASLVGCGLLSAAEGDSRAAVRTSAPSATPAPASAPQAVQPAPVQAPEDPLIVAVTDSSTRFAAELYGNLRNRPGNVVFAPLALSQSLLPVAAGVQGSASGEFGRMLHLNVPVPEAADGFSTLVRRLQRSVGGESNLTVARALWVQQWNAINDEYIDLLRQHCHSELRVIDFARPEYAVHWINRWVSDRTEDRITAIADAKSYDIHSCLVVGNAVYFRSGWQRDFDPALTEPAPFFVPEPPVERPAAQPVAPASSAAPVAAASGTPVAAAASASPAPAAAPAPAPVATADPAKGPVAAPVPPVPAAAKPVEPVAVPMMRRIGFYRMVAQPGFRLVQVPYRGEQLSLVILLPDNSATLPKVEAQLTTPRINECLRALRDSAPQRLELRLPRFKIEHSVPQLVDAFQGIGLKTVFDLSGAADFSSLGTNIDGAPIYLSAVTQSIRLVVDEQGNLGLPATSASAEPAVDSSAAAPAAFTVDRPFVFFICDQQTGALLFFGRIVDPRVS
jgi:serine protease inhibitor